MSLVLPLINLYSFPIELKPRITKIQIYETVSQDITFVSFTIYLIEKSLYFMAKHIRMCISQNMDQINA